MNFPFQLRAKTINLLASFMLGLFIVFPDVVRLYDDFGPQQPRDFPQQLDESVIKPQHEFPSLNGRLMENKMPKRQPEWGIDHIIFDFFAFFSLSLVLIFFNTNRLTQRNPTSQGETKTLLTSIAISLGVCAVFIMIYTSLEHGFLSRLSPKFGFFNGMLLFKSLFVVIISLLFGYIMSLIYKQHHMALENEQLRSENLQNRFDALSSQVNPHFFFNSLNSLASLIRDGSYDKSLKYINQLSDIFRYVLKSKWKELVTLEDEMQFLDAYRYMLEIRYKDKLFFEINVGKGSRQMYLLPALSLQPLIENVVKHNTISTESPMSVSIFITDRDILVVSNPVRQKLEPKNGTGIGLDNLARRYVLLMDKKIEIEETDEVFKIMLPMVKVNNQNR